MAGPAALFCIRYCGIGESFAYVTGPTGNTLFTRYHNKQEPRNITQDYDAHPKTNRRMRSVYATCPYVHIRIARGGVN